ncbi:hypothetical protein HYV81_03795 [Candidatus Woesearchaeota archaeon]|nr:hypothetical protein [Candidatus Woesearchaeota archaeon]
MHNKKAASDMIWIIVWMGLGLLAMAVIGYTVFGPGQLWAKGTKPLSDTTTGISSDCDNDGIQDVLDRCPCNPNKEPNADGSCSTPSNECRKLIDAMRKDPTKTNCIS